MTRVTLFKWAFSHTRVGNLLKGPVIVFPSIKNAILSQAKHKTL